jgi:hypothetical protein
MMKRFLFFLVPVVACVLAHGEGALDQTRKDRLLNLHRTILIANQHVYAVPQIQGVAGSLTTEPAAPIVVEGGVIDGEASPAPQSSPDDSQSGSGASPSPSASPSPDAPLPKTAGRFPSLLDNNIIVAFYGNPFSTKMGILGEQSMDETARLVKLKAAEWDNFNGDEHVVPAFHLIYATVHADAGVGVLSEKVVRQYIECAAANDMIVILDHQLGKYDTVECVRSMLKWLKYPNVHLAIDPEWKTLNPGKEIGSVYASEVNRAQEIIQEYLVKEKIEQKKLFIVHQFNWKQILNREQVRADFDRIDLVHNADGFGSPSLKIGTYKYVSLAKNMPVKGFKLFFPKPWKTEGFDKPLMTPEQVLGLNPRPVFINYQ